MKFLRPIADVGLTDAPLVGQSLALLAEAHKTSVCSGLAVTSTRVLVTAAYDRFIEANRLLPTIKSLWRAYLKAPASDRHRVAVRLRSKFRRAALPPEVVHELAGVLKNTRSTASERGLILTIEVISEGRSLIPSFSLPVYGGNFTLASVSRSVQAAFSAICSDEALTDWQRTDVDLCSLTVAVSFQKISLDTIVVSGQVETRETALSTAAFVKVQAGYVPARYILKKNKLTLDTYLVFKPGLEEGRDSIIQKKLCSKRTGVIANANGFTTRPIALSNREAPLLATKEILQLVKGALELEKQFGFALSVAWTKNSEGTLTITAIQPLARSLSTSTIRKFNFTDTPPLEKIRAIGRGYGECVASGKVVLVKSEKQLADMVKGGIIVAERLATASRALLSRAGAIIIKKPTANQGLDTLARELEIPIVVAEKGFSRLRANSSVTVSTLNPLRSEVYDGAWSFCSETFDHNDSSLNNQLPVWLKLLPGERVGETALLPSQGSISAPECIEKSTTQEIAERLAMIAGTFYPRLFLADFSQITWSTKNVDRIVEALKLARDQWGVKNIGLSLNIAATPAATEMRLKQLYAPGFAAGKNNFEVYLSVQGLIGIDFFKEMNEPVTGWLFDLSGYSDMLTEADKKSIYTAIRLVHARRQKVAIVLQKIPETKTDLLPLLVQEKIDSLILSPSMYLRLLPDIYNLEQKYRRLLSIRAWSTTGTLKRLPEKALSTLGVVGLSISLAGYTCQTIAPGVPAAELEANLHRQMMDLKTELKQEINNELDRRAVEATTRYQEDELAHFTFQYPASWTVARSASMVRFVSADSTGWFTVSSLPQPKNRPAELSTWQGFESVRASRFNAASSTTYLTLTVYPPAGDTTTPLVVFTGDAAHFDALLANLSNFKFVVAQKK